MTDVETMDEARFDQLLEAYGADPARWPDAERVQALRYLAATPAAHARRAVAKSLDATLAHWTLDAPGADLAARVTASAPASRLRARTLWISGVGLAAACALGVLAGAQLGSSLHPVGSERDDPAVTAVLDGATAFNLDEASS